jgi:uncharacterized membrane protein YjjB (DUF3815 family)
MKLFQSPYTRYVILVILFIWILYFLHSVTLKDALAMSFGAVIGALIGYLTVRLILKK